MMNAQFAETHFSCSRWTVRLKGIVHPKTTNLSRFTNPQVIPNLNNFCLLLNTKEDTLKNVGNQRCFYWVTEDQKLFAFPHSSKYLLLCSTEETTVCRFRTIWVNYDRICILGWTIKWQTTSLLQGILYKCG